MAEFWELIREPFFITLKIVAILIPLTYATGMAPASALILLAGVIASLANSAIKIMVHDALPKEVFGYLLGDITGLMLLMVIWLLLLPIHRPTH